MTAQQNQRRLYVRLADHVSLRSLEEPCLYDRKHDELYELNDDGFEALRRCDGRLSLRQVALDAEFETFCLDEGLLTLSPEPRPMPIALGPGPTPSLRYLELQITWRCNLACAHCYLGPAKAVDLDLATVARVLREFEAMGGMRVLISGGEPLMHPKWEAINALLAATPLRRVLLSNGVLLGDALDAGLNVDEVQISLDGMASGHQALRGKGSFDQTVEAARGVRAKGLDLSIATMVHAANLDQFEDLAVLVDDLGAQEWGIDVPCIHGRLSENPALAVTPAQAAAAMAHAYGGSYHGGSGGMACGLHLCTVGADSKVAQCGFFMDNALGEVEQGLWTCWARRDAMAISEIKLCADCRAAEDCAGGVPLSGPGLGPTGSGDVRTHGGRVAVDRGEK